MATQVVSSSPIGHKLLCKDNYRHWSVQVKTYLKAQDLWDIIEATTEPPKPEDDEAVFKAWSKKNDMALYAVQISCEPDTFDGIIEITSAKIAWDTLAKKYTPNNDSETANIVNNDYSAYAALKKAVRKGDWNAAEEFLNRHPDAVAAKITDLGDTALHMAVDAGHMHIVKELVELMSEQNLEILNNDNDTALALTAIRGGSHVLQMAECMIRKNRNLVSIGRGKAWLPVILAIGNGHINLGRYLYSHIPLECLTADNGIRGAKLVNHSIYARTFDIALHLLHRCPRLAMAVDDENYSPLLALTRLPDVLPSGNKLVFWKRWIYSLLAPLDQLVSHLLKVFGMLTASTSDSRVPGGAALQMQRELQWFKEVERIVHPRFKNFMNNDYLTAQALFTRDHKDMLKQGEKWMKGTATSCTVVGALIVTIMFAASFTVPGGNDQTTGFPMFLKQGKLFMLFIVSDALSLFSSSTSVLMFLGILTSRYAENDFLKSLPTKLIIGLSTLFFSIATMMIPFSAGLLLLLREQSWMVIPVICLACVPVTLFVLKQFPVLVDMFISTYGSGIFDRKIKRWI